MREPWTLTETDGQDRLEEKQMLYKPLIGMTIHECWNDL
jgi:hypothetical protein